MGAATKQQSETLGFQAEVKQILHLVIHSLYSHKEIFLRELISNAADAADKLRFAALSDDSLLGEDKDLKVWVEFNANARTVTIRDNGIGMTREEVISNIGTIAKSGTKDFLQALTGDAAKDSKLIGQFGVGFYSAFIVAKKVVLRTLKAGMSSDHGIEWSSDGGGEFDITNVKKQSRGTEITLHLKDGEDEFLNGWHLRHIITKYSDHIDLPIMMHKEKSPEDPKEAKDEKVIEIPEEEVVNRAKALWTLPKNEITKEQYQELYKHISHDFANALAWSHNKVEGKNEYTSLLFIPEKAPFDLWHPNKARGLKLYVKRVFILDDAEQLLPHYLRFVKGIIDSNDLPLNVSREILQNNKAIDAIKTATIKRVLGMLKHLAEKETEKYQTFWEEFGQVLKEGPAEDFANKEQIAKLLRFASTHVADTKQTVSLDDYIKRMQPEQDKIYYISAESYNAAKDSPHLEVFRKRNIEVLLLTDRVDEWLMSHLTEFEGKKFQSVAKGSLELKPDEVEAKQQEEQQGTYKDVVANMKNILSEVAKDVVISKRLTTSPACIITDANDMTPQMERLLKSAGQHVPATKPILEVNPSHVLVKRLLQEKDKKFEDLTWIIFDSAILAEGSQLQNPARFISRFNELLQELVTT